MRHYLVPECFTVSLKSTDLCEFVIWMERLPHLVFENAGKLVGHEPVFLEKKGGPEKITYDDRLTTEAVLHFVS